MTAKNTFQTDKFCVKKFLTDLVGNPAVQTTSLLLELIEGDGILQETFALLSQLQKVPVPFVDTEETDKNVQKAYSEELDKCAQLR